MLYALCSLRLPLPPAPCSLPFAILSRIFARMLKIIECPRDAMQGLHQFVPTDLKARYINQLLKVGFDTIDFGSFVSPKSITQMIDTAEVLSQLDKSKTKAKLLPSVA